LDVKLALGPEDLSPALVQKVVRHGGKDAFKEASEDLKEDLGIEVNAKQVERITERIGSEWVAARDEAVELFKQDKLPRLYGQSPEVGVVMMDGGRVLLRAPEEAPGVHAPEWKEPKYGCGLTLKSQQSKTDPQPQPPAKFLNAERVAKIVKQVKSRSSKAGEVAARAQAKTPVSALAQKRKKSVERGALEVVLRTVVASMAEAEEFGYILVTEAYLRNLDRAKRKGYVCDGQSCNWTIWDRHFRELGFVPILDFLHLLTYLYSAAHAAGGTPKQQWARYEVWLRWAWTGERQKVWAALHAAAAKAGTAPQDANEQDPRCILAEAARYVENNLSRMDYPRYRKLGLPISSAPIESVVKQCNRRIKGTEKFWLKNGVEAVLQVRAAYLSQDGRVERLWARPRPHYPSVGRNRLALVA
jgi:hypothetical protein